MSSQLPTLKRRSHPRRRVAMLSTGGLQAAAAGAGVASPSLLMPPPDDAKSSIVSGSITTLLHAALFGLLFLFAWLAPPVEEILPVKIIRELPGAKAEPAPARKILKPRQVRQVQAVRQVTAQAVAAPRVMKMSADQLKMNQIRKAVAPQAVQRRQVVSKRVEARSFDTRVVQQNVDLPDLTPIAAPTDLAAPVVDYDGPREIDPGAAVRAPENFATVPEVDQTDYTSAAPYQIEADAAAPPVLEAFEIDADVGAYAGGEGTGGTGEAVGSVRCLESAYVQRYIKALEPRTYTRWQVPEGTPPNAEVQLRFQLDASGTATHVEFIGNVTPALGNSAVAALRAASPFPPMDDDVRCLAGLSLKGTFTVPPQ